MFDKPKGTRLGVVIGGTVVKGFNTASGRIDFSAAWLGAKSDINGRNVSALPVYEPRDWQPSTDFPLFLINWKEASHTHTRTQNNALLLEIKPDNPLVIHPDTADRYAISDADLVWVESPYGRVKAKAKVSRRIHPEVVGLQHGFGHTRLGRLAKGRGTTDSPLRPTVSDPLAGQALHKETCVRIVKA